MSWSKIIQAKTKDDAKKAVNEDPVFGEQSNAPQGLREAIEVTIDKMRTPTDVERYRIETYGHVGEHGGEGVFKITFEVDR